MNMFLKSNSHLSTNEVVHYALNAVETAEALDLLEISEK